MLFQNLIPEFSRTILFLVYVLLTRKVSRFRKIPWQNFGFHFIWKYPRIKLYKWISKSFHFLNGNPNANTIYAFSTKMVSFPWTKATFNLKVRWCIGNRVQLHKLTAIHNESVVHIRNVGWRTFRTWTVIGPAREVAHNFFLRAVLETNSRCSRWSRWI